MEKLKPCPFCGSTNIRLTENCPDDPAWSSTHIECRKCHASTQKHMRTTADAITWWNSRALDPVDTHLVKNLGKWAMSNERSKIDWDSIDDEFDKFLEGFHDVDGERYEKRSARDGGEWMKHLIRKAMKTPNTDFNLTPPSESQVKS